MIILKFGYSKETRPNFPCVAFRWTFQIRKWSMGFVHQHQDTDGKWYDSHVDAYELNVCKTWKIGSDHIYYDGPHCFYHFGFFTLQLGGNWKCKKCCDYVGD